MYDEHTKTSPTTISPAFVLATSTILAQILAKHEEVTLKSIHTESDEQTTGELRATQSKEDQNLLASRESTSTTTSTTGSTAGPETDIVRLQETEAEDIRCCSCHTFKNKHDFTVEEREKFPDSTCLRCLNPPTADDPKIYFPGQRRAGSGYYKSSEKSRKGKRRTPFDMEG